jgi:hypothetical protein
LPDYQSFVRNLWNSKWNKTSGNQEVGTSEDGDFSVIRLKDWQYVIRYRSPSRSGPAWIWVKDETGKNKREFDTLDQAIEQALKERKEVHWTLSPKTLYSTLIPGEHGPFHGLCWPADGRRSGATEHKPKIAYDRRQHSVWLAVMLVSAGFTGLAEVGPGKPIPIILAAPATPAEQIAARSLAQQLGQLYPREKFLRAEALPESRTPDIRCSKMSVFRLRMLPEWCSAGAAGSLES